MENRILVILLFFSVFIIGCQWGEIETLHAQIDNDKTLKEMNHLQSVTIKAYEAKLNEGFDFCHDLSPRPLNFPEKTGKKV